MIYKHMNMQGFHGKFLAYIGKGACEINLWAHSWLNGDFGNLAIKRWGRKPIIAGICWDSLWNVPWDIMDYNGLEVFKSDWAPAEPWILNDMLNVKKAIYYLLLSNIYLYIYIYDLR